MGNFHPVVANELFLEYWWNHQETLGFGRKLSDIERSN